MGVRTAVQPAKVLLGLRRIKEGQPCNVGTEDLMCAAIQQIDRCVLCGDPTEIIVVWPLERSPNDVTEASVAYALCKAHCMPSDLEMELIKKAWAVSLRAYYSHLRLKEVLTDALPEL